MSLMKIYSEIPNRERLIIDIVQIHDYHKEISILIMNWWKIRWHTTYKTELLCGFVYSGDDG